MRLRRAVPKFPAKSSAPPRLPLRKNRSLRTRSESTLPQLLIPLHFKSFISNVYKKPGGGVSRSRSEVLKLVTPKLLSFRAQRGICFFFLPSLLPYFVTSLHHTSSGSCVHAGMPASSISSWVTSQLAYTTGVGGTSLAAVLTSSLPYFFAFDSYFTQTSPAARALSGPTSAGTGTSPPVDCQPANASAWRSHEESCAALRRLPPAVAPGTNGPS